MRRLVKITFSVAGLFFALFARWAALFLAKHVDVQRKMREEMDSVVGRGGRSPGTEDRSEMPYAEAVVHEVQRRANVAHLAISHTTLRDVEIGTTFLLKKKMSGKRESANF